MGFVWGIGDVDEADFVEWGFGNEADFVTKSMTEDEIVAAKMAKDRVESDRWYAMFSEPFPTEEDAQ